MTPSGPDSGWSAPPLGRSERLLALLALAALALLLPLWARMLISPAPQEMREGSMMLTTLAILQGQNPYALDLVPIASNVYGPFYPLVTAPFAALLGPGLFTHRLVDGLGVLATCTILFRVLRGQGVPGLLALAGAGMNLAGLLYWVGPASRPDGIGMTLLVGAYAVLAPDPRRPWRFGVAALLSVLGLATKVYFVFPVLVGAAWTFLFGGVLLGMLWGVLAVGTVVGGIAGLALLLPGWGPVVLGANLSVTVYEVDHLVRQSRDWALFSLPLLAALALGRHRIREAPDFWTFALFSGVAAIGFALGGHVGAHMTYLFHLISAPLTVVALRAASRWPLGRSMFAALVPVAVVLNAHWFPLDPARFARAEAGFAHAWSAIRDAANPTGTTEFAPLLMAAGHTPIETGHSEYWKVVPVPWPLSLVWPDEARLRAAEQRIGPEFQAALAAQRFDLVLANRLGFGLIPKASLEPGYERVEPLSIDMPWAQQAWPGDLWRPRPGSAAGTPGSPVAPPP